MNATHERGRLPQRSHQARRLLRVAILLALTLSCTPLAERTPYALALGAPTNEAHRSPRQVPIIVVVAIDGVRRRDVFEEVDAKLWPRDRPSPAPVAPHLNRLRSTGASFTSNAHRMVASGPNFVSLPGYMELFSGTAENGCETNECGVVPRTTLVDALVRSGLKDEKVAVVASWDKIADAASHDHLGFVSSGPSGGHHFEILDRYPRSRAAFLAGKDQVGYGGLRPDAQTFELAKTYLEEIEPHFLFVGFGETDEHAHAGHYAAYLEALRTADGYVAALASILTKLEKKGHPTLLLITTDHGRANNFRDHGRPYPESAESFLVASGSLVASAPPEASLAHLADVAPAVGALYGLSLNQHPRDPFAGVFLLRR